jgi:dihydroorotate dehydrogenase (fumarate)
MTHFAKRLDEAGADGLVIFNRFYQPDFDLERLDAFPSLELSRSSDLKLRLHWAAILFGNIKADIAITGGVHSSTDILKSMMAGARVAMTTSELLQHGIGSLRTMLTGVEGWMEEHSYESIQQMQGSMSQKNVANPAVFHRANYMKVLSSYALNDVTSSTPLPQ